MDARVVDHALHPRGVAVARQSLPCVFEVAVVVVEPHGQPLDDARRQFGRIGLPLLGGVVLDERLIQRPSDQLDALVVEVCRVGAGQFTGLLGDELPRLGGRVGRPEELVDGAEIDWQRVDLAVVRGVHAMHVVGECGEAVDVIPDAFGGSMEQVGTVLVDFGTGLLVDIAVHVAADVAAHIDDLDPGARALRRLLCDGQAEQARADDHQIRVHSFLPCGPRRRCRLRRDPSI